MSGNGEEKFENTARDHENFSVQNEQESHLESHEKEQEEEEQEEIGEMREEEDGVQETNQDFSDVEEYGNAQATSGKGFFAL